MPVYVRKNLVITPPSLSGLSDDEEDYLTDPEQVRDLLPQPYRMISKTLNYVLDDIWEIIRERENERIEESKRIKPPKYECAIQMQHHGTSTCVADSQDGRYLFLGSADGLVAMDAINQHTLSVWEEDSLVIERVQACLIGVQMYLISTVDDQGIGRLFAFANDALHLLKVMNEQGEAGQVLTTKCEISNEGDYIGLCLNSPSNGEQWLEVHRLPRDAWVKELEGLQSSQNKQQATASQGDGIQNELQQSSATETEQDRSQSPNSTRGGGSPSGGGGEKTVPKFSTPTIVLKIRAPAKIIGNQCITPHHAIKSVDTGDVIGTGANHLFTSQHLEHRKAVFDHLHEQYLKYLPKQDDQTLSVPTFHFLTAGRILPIGLEQPSQEGKPTAIGIWWSGSSQMMFYSLIKTGKDIEFKPEVVWPHSDRITCTTTSPCSKMLAIGLTSGIVIIWDMYQGFMRRVVRVCDDATVTRMEFLAPGVCPQEIVEYPPYPKQTACYLLVHCTDGQVRLVNCAKGDMSEPITVVQRAKTDDDAISHVSVFPIMPDVMCIVKKNGRMFLEDILKKHVLCEVTLPNTHDLTSPLQPLIVFGGQGQMLYLKGSQKDPEVDYVPESGLQSLFVFQLRSFPTLDKYIRKKYEDVPYIVHSTATIRSESLLQERFTVQALRQTRMQERWTSLKDELEMIKMIKNESRRQAGERSPYAESSIPRTPILEALENERQEDLLYA